MRARGWPAWGAAVAALACACVVVVALWPGSPSPAPAAAPRGQPAASPVLPSLSVGGGQLIADAGTDEGRRGEGTQLDGVSESQREAHGLASAVDPRYDDLRGAWLRGDRWRLTDPPPPAHAPGGTCAVALAAADGTPAAAATAANGGGKAPGESAGAGDGDALLASTPRASVASAASPSTALLAALCELEAHAVAPQTREKPRAVVVAQPGPGGPTRYYLDRDARAWIMAFEHAGFETTVEHRPAPRKGEPVADAVHASTVARFDASVCLGLVHQAACLDPRAIGHLQPHQRVSFVPGLRETLWKKDAFCIAMREALGDPAHRVPPAAAAQVIPCYVLPRDGDAFRRDFARQPGSTWMAKPVDHGEAHGLFVSTSLQRIERETNEYMPGPERIVQRYLDDPLLIRGRKFDLRVYVLVTSVSPLVAYAHTEGLVRFAARNYTKNATKSKDEYLTNTSQGKLSALLSELTRTFNDLWRHVDASGVSSRRVLDDMHSAIAATLLLSEPKFKQWAASEAGGVECGAGCYQLLGVDVIFDNAWRPHVIEVNGLPSMQLSATQTEAMNVSSSYTLRKLLLAADVVSLVFRPRSVAERVARRLRASRVGVKPGRLCDARVHRACVSHAEAAHVLRMHREQAASGGFRRIFPPADGEGSAGEGSGGGGAGVLREVARVQHERVAATGLLNATTDMTTWTMLRALDALSAAPPPPPMA